MARSYHSLNVLAIYLIFSLVITLKIKLPWVNANHIPWHSRVPSSCRFVRLENSGINSPSLFSI